jgi:hypothetical protein
MEGRNFDDLVRTLSGRNSRRSALGLLTGALGALATGQEADILAKRKKKKKKNKRKARNKSKRKSSCSRKSCPRGFQLNQRTCECECTRQSCNGGMEFDLETCSCACPRGMRECRDSCVGPDQCCPGDPPCPEDPKGCCHSPGVEVCTIDGCCPEIGGLKACNNFCVDTSIDTHHCGDCNVACQDNEQCVDGECVAKEEPCEPGPGGCCAGERSCPNGSCIPAGMCCPGVEQACPSAPGGCCNTFAGEECSDDGCCNTLTGQAVCDGQCTDISTNENCGACGNSCGSCQTCKRDSRGNYACVAPDRTPPACETCSNGEVVSGTSCGDRCCPPGAACCGGGCCGADKCRTTPSGGNCCLKVVDNRPICLVM